jgi:hypothetical protein
MSLLALLLVPVLIGVVAFFLGKRRITPGELLLQLAIVGALLTGGWHLARWTALRDFEIWNGRVVAKAAGTHGCCHSYECNCHDNCSGSGNERSCSKECDTCFEHASDLYWSATSSNNEVVYDNRCNPPGTATPASWESIQIGEPTAWEHPFTNYIKADPASVLGVGADLSRFSDRLPDYPRVVGHKAARFLFQGDSPLDAGVLNDGLAELNAALGSRYQVNAIVVVVKEDDPAFAEALRHAWLGGKKNDVVLVMGVAPPTVRFARVFAWNRALGAEDAFKEALSVRVASLGAFDGARVLRILREEIEQHYERRSFSEFEYLLYRATPTPAALALLASLGGLVSALLTFILWRNQRQMQGPAPHERLWSLLRRRPRDP